MTADTPKCLLQIDGRAMLDRQLEALTGAGIQDVIVVAGFMADAVVRHVGDRGRVIVNERYATTGSIASLAVAEPFLRGHGFLLQNGDTLYPVDLIRRLMAAPYDNACLVDSARPYRAGEYHVQTADGRVIKYSNQIPVEQSVGESAQLLRVGAGDSPAFLDRIVSLAASDTANGFPNLAYDALINGRGFWPVFTAGLPWWEIDTTDDAARCQAEYVSRPRTTAAFAPPAPLTSRISSFVKSPGLPGRLSWLPRTAGAWFRNPMSAAREVNAFRRREISLSALDLLVNGQRILRLALSEAQAAGFHPLLLWGTLLGCVRNRGFIRGDQDIDLGVMAADAHRLPDFRQRMTRHGFNVRIGTGQKLSLVHPRHPRLYIDLDVIRPHRDGWAITNSHTTPQKIFCYHFPASVFAAMRPATFEKTLPVLLPNDAEGFLTAVYGDWRTPARKVEYCHGPLNTEVELIPQVGTFVSETENEAGPK